MRKKLSILLPMLLVLFALFVSAQAEEIPVKGMKLKSSKVTISLYKQKQLAFAKLVPENATLTWTSSNESVATVSDSGLITALAPGKTVIKAESINGKKVLCSVTVKRIKVTSITMEKKLDICPGREASLNCVVKPASASDPVPVYASSDPTKVTVDADGTVHAIAYTDTPVVITATAVDGSGKSAKCLVTVRDVPVSSVKMGAKSVTITYGTTKTITATALPVTAKDTSLEWSSSNPDVATVDQNGVVTTVGGGKTQITATAKDGSGKKGTCTVTVKTVAVTGISLDSKKIKINEGESTKLTATVKPANASFPTVTWKSLDESRATVDQDGTVHAVSGGLVTIKATAGKKSTTCKVYIYGEGTRRLTISAVGDIALGGDPRTNKKTVDPGGQQRFYDRLAEIGTLDGVFENFKELFQNDDLTIGNLECTLSARTNHLADSKSILIIGKKAYAKYLKSNGFDVLSIQNNHSKDLGEDGYEDTKNALYSAKIVPSFDNQTTYKTIKGVKIGFLGLFNCNMTHLRNRVKAMSGKCDYLIVTIHWSKETEFVYQAPTDNQKSFARTAVDCGADLVLCCHTHRVNGIECYKNKYIVYDLGTFVNYVNNPKNASSTDFDTMVFQISYYIFADGTMEFEKVKVIPCAYSSSETTNDMIPMIYTKKEDKDRVINKIQRYSNFTIESE